MAAGNPASEEKAFWPNIDWSDRKNQFLAAAALAVLVTAFIDLPFPEDFWDPSDSPDGAGLGDPPSPGTEPYPDGTEAPNGAGVGDPPSPGTEPYGDPAPS